jgi:uncharacterized membrane protein
VANLWAVAYDDVARAERLCAELVRFDAEQILEVEDLLVVLRQPDGNFEFRRHVYPTANAIASGGALDFLVGALLLQPLIGPGMGALAALLGPAIGAFFGNITGAVVNAGVDRDFIQDVQAAMKPGSVIVFALGIGLNDDKLLPRLQGLGGMVLRTSVDLERTSQVQALLNTEAKDRIQESRSGKSIP